MGRMHPPGLNRVNNGDDDDEDDNADVSKDGNDYDNGIILFFPVKTFWIILQVKGLVKQHIDSFNYFINVDVSRNCIC